MKSWREECGVFGIWNDPEAAHLTYLGLYSLQHRGQESAGIVVLNGQTHIGHRGMGLVNDVFNRENLPKLSGRAAIGHVRYSTHGVNMVSNVQPLTAQLRTGPLAVSHNGNVVNANRLRDELKQQGAIFSGTNDTEIVLHLLAHHSSSNLIECLKASLPKLEGAYSFLILAKDCLVAVRDPYGFRPLVLGRRDNSQGSSSTVLASETCAFDLINARYEREIEPGEIFWIDEQGEHSERFAPAAHAKARCIFEHVYFARPDSVVFEQSVYQVRRRMGEILAAEKPVDADLVVPVPDSGVPAALGFSQASGIPFELGIIRNHYIGRTFIQPEQSSRSFGVRVKLNAQSAILKGKRVVLIDDSVVRGTTSQKIVNLVRAAGATEVHLRIAAPPTIGPCYYGVDTPERSQLIAAQKTLEEIREYIGADSLGYISHGGLLEAAQATGGGYCSACFSGRYPTPVPQVEPEREK